MHNPDTARFTVRQLRQQIKAARPQLPKIPEVPIYANLDKVLVLPRGKAVRGWGSDND